METRTLSTLTIFSLKRSFLPIPYILSDSHLPLFTDLTTSFTLMVTYKKKNSGLYICISKGLWKSSLCLANTKMGHA